LPRSLAIFATILPGPMPTETARPVAARTRSFSSRPIPSGGPRSRIDPVTSMNASSSESGSTAGLTVANTSPICALTRRYFVMSPERKTASGQSARACAVGIADRTPNGRASYDAAMTTPRRDVPPTITGRPRSSGRSRCSTAA